MNNLIKTQNMLNCGDRILAAVSGGADSVAMLHCLNVLRHNPKLKLELVCAHINHQLRGADSDKDERFVEALASQYRIPFYSEPIDVRGYAAEHRLSIETAARRLRLAALERFAQQARCTCIATAHHKDDQAETLLMRLLRGTAFAGLAGIHPTTERNGLRWVRPMLHLRRLDIERYCRDNGLLWHEDKSNQALDYTRNWVRHCLLPIIQRQSQSDIVDKLQQLSDSAYQMQLRLNAAVDAVWHKMLIENDSHHVVLESDGLSSISPLIAGEILRRVYGLIDCGLRDLTERHYQRYFETLRNPDSPALELPGGCRVQRDGTQIVFLNKNIEQSLIPDDAVEIHESGYISFGHWTIHSQVLELQTSQFEAFIAKKDPHCQWFDLEQLTFPLVARSRKVGDRFVPYGMKTPKRVGKFLTETQVDKSFRKETFVIENSAGILWLAPLRRSTLAPVAAQTKQVLALTTQFNPSVSISIF